MILVQQTRPVGFFSSFNIMVGALNYFRKNNIRNFYVSWTNGLYQEHDANLFDIFFYTQSIPNPEEVEQVLDAVEIGNVYEAILKQDLFLELHKTLQHYDYFNNVTYKKCLEACVIRPNSLGVHVRRTDHAQHSELLDIGEYFRIVDTKIAEGNYTNLYVTTDDLHMVPLFKDRYGSMVYENHNALRSNNGVAIHFGNHNNKEKLALDVMVDAISLANCDEIIITSSNIAGYALMLNPTIKYKQIDTHKNHY